MFQFPIKIELNNPKDEAEATSQFLAILRSAENEWRWKIPDIGQKTKPVDILGNVSGRFVACELKYLDTIPTDLVATIHKKLELHQIATLVQNHRIGGLSIIGGYVKPFNSLYLFEWGQTLTNWSEL